MIYIYKNNQQSGPYEEHIVLEQLRSGTLSPQDLGIRHGESDWAPLGSMFPQAAAPVKLPPPAPPPPEQFTAADVPVGSPTATGTEMQYRSTLIPKVFFGLCLVGAIVIVAAAVYYVFTFTSSGNLETDLSRLGYKDLATYLAIGTFVGGAFAFLAFLLSFKRKLIRSNGLRIALRVFFILILLVGLGSVAFGAFSYFTASPPVMTKESESNELLRALERGSQTRSHELALLLPIGAGLFLFGLSGILMTKRGRRDIA